MKIQCPNCTTRYETDSAKIPVQGIFARCGKCQTRFFVKRKTALPEMPSAICGNCGQQIGRLEKSFPYESCTVCYPCHKKLEAAMFKRNDSLTESQTDVKEKRRTGSSPPGGLGNRFLSLFSNDLAIDLGTANTLVYKKRKGIVLNESSVVALRTDRINGHRILAVGQEARQMMGKTPANVMTIRPMRDGVIADFEATGVMLQQFIRKVRSRMNIFKPRMVIAVPSGITSVEKRAVKESAEMSGARMVFLVEEPMAAAVGADMPISEPTCNMVVDIGGGTTEVAVISLGGIVFGLSIKVAGDKMDEAIMRYVKKQYNFLIGERTAEEVKISIGNACPESRHPEMIEVKGWEVVSGRPMILPLNALEVREAISDHLKSITDAIKTVLEKIPQELAAHILDRGIVLTGGVALLKNLDKYLTQETGLPVRVADDPLTTVVRGSGKILDNRHLFKKILNA